MKNEMRTLALEPETDPCSLEPLSKSPSALGSLSISGAKTPAVGGSREAVITPILVHSGHPSCHPR